MYLAEKVRAVEEVFADLDREIIAFKNWSTLHCNTGCGKCCIKPDIEATIIEFLPFAHYLYQQKVAFEWLEKLRNSTDSYCALLNREALHGMCSGYLYRGLICRLFGFSSRMNKYGKKELVTCQVIKTEQQAAFLSVSQQVQDNLYAMPVMSTYYTKLHAIDPLLAQDFYPVNQAIKRAIETVLQYYAYREDPDLQTIA